MLLLESGDEGTGSGGRPLRVTQQVVGVTRHLTGVDLRVSEAEGGAPGMEATQ